ncbi:MAG: dihydrofolate reductase family protein [Candidatus Eisenbacteria bacterium]|nr:dihydrofolate reductase family protein [Candidatus Eisenbacteria bacterium]
MSRLRFGITMSADGYVAGPRQSLQNPLGEGGEKLHEWVVGLRTFLAIHGKEGGATGPDDEVVAESVQNIGATIMGRQMFGGGDGPWGSDPPWRGWWGDDPPFHHPVFVLTHHEREPLPMKGGTTFYFVTDGIRAALDMARKAAKGRDVNLAGGADAAQQYLRAGLIDEMEIHVVPLMLGDGARLFENTEGRQAEYECVRVLGSPSVSHFKYRRKP